MTNSSNPAKELSPDWLTSLQSLLATIVIAVFVITYVVQAFQIPSPSMENTLLTGDYLLVDKLCYGGGGFINHIIPYRPIRRGDIIVFHYPVNPAQHFVKRVVGVPGDRIHLVNKRVFVNGVPLAEPYVRYIKPEHNAFRDYFSWPDFSGPGNYRGLVNQVAKLVEGGQFNFPESHYFAMGDNRDDS